MTRRFSSITALTTSFCIGLLCAATLLISANGIAAEKTGLAPEAKLQSPNKKNTAPQRSESEPEEKAPTDAPIKLDDKQYGVHYLFSPQPESDLINVEIQLRNSELLKSISFRYDKQRHLNFSGDGKVKRYKSSVRWEPNIGKAKDVVSLRYQAKVSRERDNGGFDARITSDWAIFRGDKIVPTAKVRSRKGSYSFSTLEFRLPPGWTSVDTGWRKTRDWQFRIDNPERRFDRPTGWMIAGKLGTRRDFLEGSELSIGAPQGSQMQRMNALALINLVWPEVQRAFRKLPPKILIVSAGDPMWRGGLSSPNSFYVHADRPLISENGTSTLLHELTHVITRIRGGKQSDWISEGLAEFYSIELMLRSGAMNQARYNRVLRSLARWSAKVTTLRSKSSSGATTARAVLLFHELDQELRKESQGQYSLDDVTRELMAERKVSNKKLHSIVESLLGKPSKALETSLLK